MKMLLSEYGSNENKGAEILRMDAEYGVAYKVVTYRNNKMLYEAIFDTIQSAENFAEDFVNETI